MALTPKQEKFVSLVVEGKNLTEAYRLSYDTNNMKENTINRKASFLFKEIKVRARYDELMDELKDKAIWNVQMAQETLLGFLEICKVDKDKKHALGYIKELNALLKLYDNKIEDKTIKIKLIGTEEVENEDS